MPELPEVEIISRGLNTLLTDRVISSVQTLYPGCIHGQSRDIDENLPGRKVLGVRRRAKLAIIDLHDCQHLVFHLKMTGRLLFDQNSELGVDKHTHLSINFSDRSRLLFRDVRKFGYCCLLQTTELENWRFFKKLGPEPFQLDAEGFARIFAKRKGKIKALLLNQEVIAGIGNIYADEALHLAGIHPAQPCGDIPVEKLKQLYLALQQVLKQAIDSGGSSFKDYVNSLGARG
ncbi:MAG: bifunctional DNA-formamidopyrimidine glycosylase/DNA-(apurinic or apyrimidinic site) lyase, partial [Desulfohalobiaceae bacterium]|nr:bifunctional DNA-formamidopyrimidine glycosylase/DNA-(apurinic or apyrimidinic site) lyase [Desulfohalobiaceae bacterium]